MRGNKSQSNVSDEPIESPRPAQATGLLPCPKCSRTFRTQGALNGHQRTHSFFGFLSKLTDKETRQKEREDLNAKIVVAAIHHYTVNQRPEKVLGAAPHCDVCAVVSGVDTLLIRDLNAWLSSPDTSAGRGDINVTE